MIKFALAALVAVVSLAAMNDAEARGRRVKHHAPVQQNWSGPDIFGHWQGFSPMRAIGSTSRFIRGRLICAVNVNAALAANGIKGTGSAMARSFHTWGQRSGPVPGAVAIFSRRGGGHVAIVDSVRSDGTVIYKNPSARRQQWVVGPYSRRPIEFRVASAL